MLMVVMFFNKLPNVDQRGTSWRVFGSHSSPPELPLRPSGSEVCGGLSGATKESVPF